MIKENPIYNLHTKNKHITISNDYIKYEMIISNMKYISNILSNRSYITWV